MRAQRDLILFHPDYTVGSGVAPDLLTLPSFEEQALAGLRFPSYRRWGITPRPENECRKDRQNRNMVRQAATQDGQKESPARRPGLQDIELSLTSYETRSGRISY